MIKIGAIILENLQGELLLYLRDDKPTIPFPNHWDLFGGHVEEGEEPLETLMRELDEELEFDKSKLTEIKFYKNVVVDGAQDAYANEKYIYTGILDQPESELKLIEDGQKLQFFGPDEIKDLKIANILKDVLLEYLNKK